MKTAGLIIVSAIICFTGNYFSKRKTQAVKILETTVLFIKYIKTQIGFIRTPLEKIFESADKTKEFICCKYIKNTYEKLEKGLPFENAWISCINEFYSEAPIDENTKQMLISFANVLGESDINGQMQNCDTYIGLFEEKISALKNKTEKSVKLINTMTVFAASFIVILFI